MHDADVTRDRSVAVWVIALLVVLAGCAGPPETATAPAPAVSRALPDAVSADTPRPAAELAGPKTIRLWHRWPGGEATTIRSLLDDFEASRPDVQIEMMYQSDLAGALLAIGEMGESPDIVALPGDQISEFTRNGWLTPLDDYVDFAWLADTYLGTSVEALRSGGKLWGLPMAVQTVTFIYNLNLIGGEDLAAQTSELLARARQYQGTHDGIWYLAYPAKDDIYFAAPWFYGAGAWYAREDGSVGLNTPAGEAAAAFLSSLHEVMPLDIDYTLADTLFKSEQAAIIVNGPWYLSELEALNIPYGLQIMPVVSSSGQPARPLVSVDGLALGPAPRHAETAAQVMAYLTSAESQMQLARAHGLIPANQMAIRRAGDEGLVVIVHFAKQAELGQALPTTPYWDAAWSPVQSLLNALWNGEPVQPALERAQREAEALIDALANR